MLLTQWLVVIFCCVLFTLFKSSCSKRTFLDPPTTLTPFSSWKSWKTWGDFNNSENWSGGHIPCSGDRVVFPKNLKVVAYLGSEPTNSWNSDLPVQVREVQLPWHGVIVLPWDGQLLIMGENGRDAKCPGTDVLFTSRENVWLDPANWEDPAVPPEEADAVPHVRRIPCGQDVAYFSQPFFRVLLPDFEVRTRALYIFTAPTFYRHLWEHVKTFFGSNLISPLPEWDESPLHLADSDDSMTIGDECGLGVSGTSEEAQQLMDAVCRNVMCPSVDCISPVRPHLHCCHICGAVVELHWQGQSPTPDILAVKHTVRQAVEDFTGDALTPNSPVAVHASLVPTEHGLLQVVVLQRSPHGEEAQAVAALISDTLQGWSGYGVTTLLASGGPLRRATATSVFSTLFLPLIAAILAMAAILFYLGEVRSFSELKTQLDAVVFARFENTPGADDADERVEVRINKSAASPSSTVRSARGSWTASPRQFQNPLFNEAPVRSSDTALKDFSTPLDMEEKGVTHENPLYVELLKREKEMDSAFGSDGASSSSPSPDDSIDIRPLVDIDL